MPRHPHSLRLALTASLIIWGAVVAHAADTKVEVPASADGAAVEFLVASSAKDFKASGAKRPVAIRGARVGFLAESGKGVYLLCGAFKTETTAQAKWTDFATIKTSDYEQWLGGTAKAYCGQRTIKWYPADQSAALLKAIKE